jgi:hypothetical protein
LRQEETGLLKLMFLPIWLTVLTVEQCRYFRIRDIVHPSNERVLYVCASRIPTNGSQFDALLASYESLAQTTLFTLRVEIRCHIIFYLDQAIKEGNFGLTEEEAEEEDLDPTIVELCKNLAAFEDLLSTTIQPKDSTYFSSFFFDTNEVLYSQVYQS